MWHRHIHRTYLPGAIYFVTTDVRDRIPFFQEEHLARIIEQSIWHERVSRFIVYAYVVMQDHLHVLLRPTKRNISEIMRSIKTNSSREINRHLYSAGHATRAMQDERFSWQEKFYDHIITDDRDFRHHVEYIRYNPVKAGLCPVPEEHPFLFVDEEAIDEILAGG